MIILLWVSLPYELEGEMEMELKEGAVSGHWRRGKISSFKCFDDLESLQILRFPTKEIGVRRIYLLDICSSRFPFWTS